MVTPREHILEAQRLIGAAQAELTHGQTLVAKGTLLLVTNELNYALAALFGGPEPSREPPADPFRCDPTR